MSFTKENILKAIAILSGKVVLEDNQEFRNTDIYLRQAERHASTWRIIFEILSDDTLTKDDFFFAAKFLKQKMYFDFYQVNSQEVPQLLSSIISIFFKKTPYLYTNYLTIPFGMTQNWHLQSYTFMHFKSFKTVLKCCKPI